MWKMSDSAPLYALLIVIGGLFALSMIVLVLARLIF